MTTVLYIGLPLLKMMLASPREAIHVAVAADVTALPEVGEIVMCCARGEPCWLVPIVLVIITIGAEMPGVCELVLIWTAFKRCSEPNPSEEVVYRVSHAVTEDSLTLVLPAKEIIIVKDASTSVNAHSRPHHTATVTKNFSFHVFQLLECLAHQHLLRHQSREVLVCCRLALIVLLIGVVVLGMVSLFFSAEVEKVQAERERDKTCQLTH